MIRHGDSGWVTPDTNAYENEAHLRDLLVANPARVPSVTEEAFSVSELLTTAGPIDVTIVDIDGAITVVECKLSSSSERRRMIIGQVVDYASAIWLDGPPAFLSSWERRGGPVLEEGLTKAAMEQLRANVEEGRINLCLAVDHIDADLRRLIEYLNLVTKDHVRVTALQLAYSKHGDIEILVPSTYGGEIAAAKARRSPGPSAPWTRESFLEALTSDSDKELALRLFELLDDQQERRGNHELLWMGTSPGGGVFFHPFGLRYAPFQLWRRKDGQLMIYGNWRNYQGHTGLVGYARLAALLGQDYQGKAGGVPLRTLNLDELWAVACECAIEINA